MYRPISGRAACVRQLCRYSIIVTERTTTLGYTVTYRMSAADGVWAGRKVCELYSYVLYVSMYTVGPILQ